MKKQKLNLEALEIESFVTSLKEKSADTLKGGSLTMTPITITVPIITSPVITLSIVVVTRGDTGGMK